MTAPFSCLKKKNDLWGWMALGCCMVFYSPIQDPWVLVCLFLWQVSQERPYIQVHPNPIEGSNWFGSPLTFWDMNIMEVGETEWTIELKVEIWTTLVLLFMFCWLIYLASAQLKRRELGKKRQHISCSRGEITCLPRMSQNHRSLPRRRTGRVG